jgi:methylmalonyl-CoA/ethylmalonyl-CoA epimerase
MDDDPRIGPVHQIAFGCSDIERSISFYRDLLGLRLIATFDPPGLAFFQIGQARLMLEQKEAPDPGTTIVYLRVPDIQHSHMELEQRGVTFISDPHLIHRDEAGTFGEAGAEEWMAFFTDPDDNKLALAWRGLVS